MSNVVSHTGLYCVCRNHAEVMSGTARGRSSEVELIAGSSVQVCFRTKFVPDIDILEAVFYCNFWNRGAYHIFSSAAANFKICFVKLLFSNNVVGL